MKTSPAGRAALTREEGRVLRVYRDAVGILTVGVGHVVQPGEGLAFGEPITPDECDALLEHDLERFEAAINAVGTWTQTQFDALILLVFNIGAAAFASSTVLRDLRANAPRAEVARAWCLWCKAGGVDSPALLARRQREVVLFFSEAAQ